MFKLSWTHTRKKTPVTRNFKTFGEAWVFIATVRAVFPKHAFVLNGNPV